MIRVLLADDADDLRLLIRISLETDGRFEIVGDAANGTQAVELLERERPDVVILDMAMPEMDGLDVLVTMRARGFDCKVLAFSGFNGAVEREATALGADDYLRKGAVTIHELIPRLLALCA